MTPQFAAQQFHKLPGFLDSSLQAFFVVDAHVRGCSYRWMIVRIGAFSEEVCLYSLSPVRCESLACC